MGKSKDVRISAADMFGPLPSKAGAPQRFAPVEDAIEVPTALRIAVVGAGQGGGRLAGQFWSQGYRRVCAINTTDQDFADLPAEMLKIAPPASSDARGAAKDPGRGKRAFEENHPVFLEGVTKAWGPGEPDLAIICVGLGGGTGSGFAAPLVSLVKKLGARRVGVLAAMPRAADGPQVARNAAEAYFKLRDMKVSPLIVIDNERVAKLAKTSMASLYPTANQVSVELFHAFNTRAAEHSQHQTFDVSEFVHVLEGGVCTFGAIMIDRPNDPTDVSQRIRESLASNCMAECDLKTADRAACLLVAGPVLDDLGPEYFDAASAEVERLIGNPQKTVIVHPGIYRSEGSSERESKNFKEGGISAYTCVSGLADPIRIKALLDRAGPVASDLATHLRLS